jgi:hypothetical protein
MEGMQLSQTFAFLTHLYTYVICSLSQSPREALEITRDLYYLAQTEFPVGDGIRDAGDPISGSRTLSAYVGLSLLEGVNRALSRAGLLQAVHLKLSEGAIIILDAARSFKPRILIRRAMHRIESFIMTIHIGEKSLFCLPLHAAQLPILLVDVLRQFTADLVCLHAKLPLRQATEGEDGLSVRQCI